MIFTRCLSIFFSLSLGVYITFTKATTFHVVNQCPYTVWVAGSPLGGWQLNTSESRSFTVNPGTKYSQIWGRTNCRVDDDVRAKCQTGDCSGLLQCQNLGSPPLTLAEINLNVSNGSLNLDFMDISLVYGFNIPMSFGPATNVCRTIQCTGDIIEQCPEDLQAPGGCYSACKVFKTGEYCCPGLSCGPTEYSRFFKKRCPNAHTYPYDDANKFFTCPAGTNYKVVFCPSKMGIEVHDHATFEIRNQCPYTVWVGAVPGGGRRLDHGQSWTLNLNASTIGRIWARTNCNFDGAGLGHCETGDCGGLLTCQAYGAPPNTLAEYALNQYNNLDFFDISLVDGFNVPMNFSPMSNGCSRGIKCAADINGQCPAQLTAPGGCNNPCTVFKTDRYCCNSGNCGPTNYSRFFKTRCPDAYSYPKDDQTSTFTCPGGTNYRVVFCP